MSSFRFSSFILSRKFYACSPLFSGGLLRDTPPSYWPHRTIYNRFIRWSEVGVFGRIFLELAKGGGETAELMIDAIYLKAHRTVASLLKKGLFPSISDAPKVG